MVDPARGMLFIAVATTYPLMIGTTCVIPSPESITVPVRSPVAYEMLETSISAVLYVPCTDTLVASVVMHNGAIFGPLGQVCRIGQLGRMGKGSVGGSGMPPVAVTGTRHVAHATLGLPECQYAEQGREMFQT